MDLIDSYLVEIQERAAKAGGKKTATAAGEDDDLFHGFCPEKQLEQVVLDLFSAAVETLKTSLLWSVVYMLHNPEINAKIQKELDQVVGPDRLPNIDDMASLPYTRATLCEIMRRSSVVPMGTTHSTDRAIKFEGYEIPKNAHVIPLLHAVHMDAETWENPEEFRPERFLSPDGSKVVKPENFIPFGVGQRMCLGDNFAEKQFFLFFSSLLHTFELHNPSGQPLPSLRGVAAVTVTPQDFEVIFVPRAKHSTTQQNSADLDKTAAAAPSSHSQQSNDFSDVLGTNSSPRSNEEVRLVSSNTSSDAVSRVFQK